MVFVFIAIRKFFYWSDKMVDKIKVWKDVLLN
jgi:hypothetical protein